MKRRKKNRENIKEEEAEKKRYKDGKKYFISKVKCFTRLQIKSRVVALDGYGKSPEPAVSARVVEENLGASKS